jgi:MtN3 and saliva related transmembrane protein
LTELIGVVAATITSFASLPQLYKTWTTKKADDLSYWMLAFLLFGITMWLVYGSLIDALPVVIESTVSLVSVGLITVLKFVYGRRS